MPRTYKQTVIKLLFGTATHCAYPGCDAKLIFKDRGLYTPTVEIAHIRSEKPDGPRYDSSYPSEKINDFENLLLLCGQHHPPVDQHESAYGVVELVEWKRRQAQQIERPIPRAELAAIERVLNDARPIASDAVLRGPVAHLGEAERLQQAEERVSEAPGEAAGLFDQVAAALEASPFAQHASIVRARQAKALEAAEDFEAAAKLRVELGWRSYRSGDPFSVGQHVNAIVRYQNHVQQTTVRSASGLSAAGAFGYDRHVTLEHLASAFDSMQGGDIGRIECGLTLAEQAITWRRMDLLTARIGGLTAMANDTPTDDAGLALRARILMCVAEASDDWSELVSSARHLYPPRVTAWIAARHARYLTLGKQSDQAIQRWLDAIDGAIQAGVNESAAAWLYSQRGTRMRFGKVEGDPNDLHRLAQALKASGGGSVLSEPAPLAERAALRMLDQKWPDALQFLHQYLYHSVISASWEAEQAAHVRFGDLFAATGVAEEAIRHYVRGGDSKKLEQFAKKLPDRPVHFHPPAGDAPHWERIASFRFAKAAASLFPAVVASEWSEVAINELTSTAPGSWPTDTWYPAFDAFAAVADEASWSEAEKFLDLTSGYLSREPGTHHRTDDAHISALAKIGESHPDLQGRILLMLCDAIKLGNEVAQQAVSEGQEILARDSATTGVQLADAAGEGNVQAAIALILADADRTSAIEVAKMHVARDSAPRVHIPGQMTLGTSLRQSAVLATVLEESARSSFVTAMMVRLRDRRDDAYNRADALAAVSTVAPSLSDEMRDKVFRELMDFAQGPTESELSFGFGDDDPFSRFKVSLGAPPLAARAAQVAAKVGHRVEQYDDVQRLTLSLLPSADDGASFALASGLREIPAEFLRVSVPPLAGHSNRWIRCFAAISWARDPQRWPDLGVRLARDPEPSVRYALADALRPVPEHSEVRNILGTDHRREVRRRIERGHN
ncbi:hypothetical protein [Micromonospora musae]|uniref:hypothetical protein n=1 Tax=Micromonospora musae TaxID=1894970 RepID=UPI0011C40E25|nr:hypothetical protein [Micromonospora musae]